MVNPELHRVLAYENNIVQYFSPCLLRKILIVDVGQFDFDASMHGCSDVTDIDLFNQHLPLLLFLVFLQVLGGFSNQISARFCSVSDDL
jgi:hypothetical protein